MHKTFYTGLVMLALMCILSCTPLIGADLAKDFGISFGHVGLFDDYYHNGLHTYLGITKGLTGQLEANLYVQSEITPRFFGDNQLGLDIAYSLLGKRWDVDGFAGSGVNMLVSVGILAGYHHMGPLGFALDALVVKLTPVTVGTVHVGKRDRFCTVGLCWNFWDNSVSFQWNFLISDLYLKGTWRDDPWLGSLSAD